MRLGLAVVLGAACASCTLLVSTSGLVGGEGTPAPGDGDGGAASDADASLDGGPRGDGSASDSESGSDAGGLPCGEPNVIVCDDFERTTGLGSWTGEQVSTGGAVGTTTMDARRGQRAFRAFTPASSDIGNAFYGIDYGKVATKRIEYRFALRVLGAASAGTLGQVQNFSIKKGADNWNVYVHVQDYGVYLAEQSFPNGTAAKYEQYPIPEILQGGPWRDVVVEVTIGSPSRLRVTVDGKQSVDHESTTGIPSGAVGAVTGIGYQGGHPRSEVLVDDVVLIVE